LRKDLASGADVPGLDDDRARCTQETKPGVLWEHADASKALAPILGTVLHESDATQVVDLCSGAGGSLIGIQRELEHIGGNVPCFKVIVPRYACAHELPAWPPTRPRQFSLMSERTAADRSVCDWAVCKDHLSCVMPIELDEEYSIDTVGSNEDHFPKSPRQPVRESAKHI
jgi:hypothetical protein